MYPDFAAEYERLKQRNTALEHTLSQAREALLKQQELIEQLSTPPFAIGQFAHTYGTDEAIVLIKGERHIVKYDSALDVQQGQEVVINENLAIVDIVTDTLHLGDALSVTRILDDGRLVVGDEQDGRSIALPYFLLGEVHVGDRVLVNGKTGLAYEVIPDDSESEELLLEVAPDLTYDDIGGLEEAIEQLTDAVELPFLYKELHAVYELDPPKGVLLYGPPGGGKTMLAKAVANTLAKKAGHEDGYFINIAGPELLSKWVGETERQIRDVFKLARTKAATGVPVVIFFDEVEALFPIRGSGVSSDIEKTIVPQMLAEIDGVKEGLSNVIVIAATNRPDLIDPALLRPGRLDIKIRIDRPSKEGALQILGLYLHQSLPVTGCNRDQLLTLAAESIYDESPENEFLEVVYSKGDKEKLYFKDFVSGAMLMNIVSRAKRISLKNEIGGAARGITWESMELAINQEFHENEDLPNTTNPDDWGRISGRQGDRIVSIRSLVHDKKRRPTTVENISTGQYL